MEVKQQQGRKRTSSIYPPASSNPPNARLLAPTRPDEDATRDAKIQLDLTGQLTG